MTSNRRILLVEPSQIVARGLERVFEDLGEFRVTDILSDLSRSTCARLRQMDADIILVDPSVFDIDSRMNVRSILSEFTDVPVVAVLTSLQDEDSLRQYDGVIQLCDTPSNVVLKVRAALESVSESPRSEGEDLSQREKEILICVAKGMLNKEIADQYNISIYTVITHRKNITRKTGIKTVAGLTVYALLNNLIDINSVE